MLTATRAGMYPLGVLWGFRPESELLEFGAKTLVQAPGRDYQITGVIQQRYTLHFIGRLVLNWMLSQLNTVLDIHSVTAHPRSIIFIVHTMVDANDETELESLNKCSLHLFRTSLFSTFFTTTNSERLKVCID